VDEFLANEAKGTRVIGARSLEEMVAKLKKPRRVMLLVKAGSAVDDFIQKLVSILVLSSTLGGQNIRQGYSFTSVMFWVRRTFK